MAPIVTQVEHKSQEFFEVYTIVSGLLDGLSGSGRYSPNLIIEATDEAITNYEDGYVLAVARGDGRG